MADHITERPDTGHVSAAAQPEAQGAHTYLLMSEYSLSIRLCRCACLWTSFRAAVCISERKRVKPPTGTQVSDSHSRVGTGVGKGPSGVGYPWDRPAGRRAV